MSQEPGNRIPTPPSDLRFLDPHGEIRTTKNLLPHWQQPGVCYFVTFRLADSIPVTLSTQMRHERKQWLANYPEPWSPEPPETIESVSISDSRNGSMPVTAHVFSVKPPAVSH